MDIADIATYYASKSLRNVETVLDTNLQSPSLPCSVLCIWTCPQKNICVAAVDADLGNGPRVIRSTLQQPGAHYRMPHGPDGLGI